MKKAPTTVYKKPVILSRSSPKQCRSRQTIYKVILPNSNKVQKPKEVSERSTPGDENRNSSMKEDVNKVSRLPCELLITGSDTLPNSNDLKDSNHGCKTPGQSSGKIKRVHQPVKTVLVVESQQQQGTKLVTSNTTVCIAKRIDTDNVSNVSVEDLCTLTGESVPASNASLCTEDHKVENKSVSQLPKMERKLDQTSVHQEEDGDEDDTVDESHDYSNPRSTESLDMECHESGDDTVIVVKEKLSGIKRKVTDRAGESVIAPKLHRPRTEGEIHFVSVGEPLKRFLESHPSIQGMYLNRGKRAVKRKFVSVIRQKTAVDTGSWKRGSNIHERNRLDDAFELTEEGARTVERIRHKQRRGRVCSKIGICGVPDTIIVNANAVL